MPGLKVRRHPPLLTVVTAVVGIVASVPGTQCARSPLRSVPRVIILGLDGMDYEITRTLMAEGRLPGLSQLAKTGGFSSLGTAMPPQSPVAWSDFITGMDAGGHGIFDFIHRDPKTLTPYLSTSRAHGAGRTLKVGRWQIPLSGGEVELLRRGQAFWEVLEKRGVPTTILRIPANFPPSGTASRELSGMGTPDVRGGYGDFSYYTSDRLAFLGKKISGGEIHRLEIEDGVARAQLFGPDNPFLTRPSKLTVDFAVYLDPDQPAVKLTAGDEERVLREGEWSDWVPIAFDMIPTQSLAAEVRFYLRSVRPELALYVSPINFDPLSPAMPLSTPASYAAELAKATGRYYTQGMPENTGVLKAGILSQREFLDQAEIAGREVLDQFPHVLKTHGRGLLFYYVGNLDLVSHMTWRPMDPQHPAYDAKSDAAFREVVGKIYEELDGLVRYALEHKGDDTLLVVMSDHGFTSWRRVFHLNAWLHRKGYLAVKDESLPSGQDVFRNVDWSRTRAYALGLNGLYLNLAGRERDGIVKAAEKDALLAEIRAKLLAEIDPKTGKPAVANAYLRDEAYSDLGQREIGPDLVVGYAKGTRTSDESALGEVEREVLSDNREPWSGDHCMDPPAVPGILATSRPLKKSARSLKDLAAAILAEFGVEKFPVTRAAGASAKS